MCVSSVTIHYFDLEALVLNTSVLVAMMNSCKIHKMDNPFASYNSIFLEQIFKEWCPDTENKQIQHFYQYQNNDNPF